MVVARTIYPSADTSDCFILPDLISCCSFPLRRHPKAEAVAAASDRWLDTNCPGLSPKKRTALYALKCGMITAHCYPDADEERFRIVADFLVYLFHLDNISDEMAIQGTEQLADIVMNALWFPERYMPTHQPGKEHPLKEPSVAKLTRDFWSRCIKDAKAGPQARFKENMGLFFAAVQQQASDRHSDKIPDLESYIAMRRDTSGCKPSFDLIEYAMGLDLPDFVADHPTLRALNQAANDLVTWSNDIFSYNVEQARGDTHNMVAILMAHYGMSVQAAVDFVGDLCKQTMDTFVQNQERLPSWGPEVDTEVALYVKGLQDWMVGSLHWSFMTERYFGKLGPEIKEHRIVKLLPRKVKA